ncbi:CehA/McbA family metallohydrolase [Rhodobacteraceae bacterium NNCM2]|nr:CehA/McbA family metallohydrolase [Coraliihabitans acroporae]
MQLQVFGASGHFFRGNLHTHCDRSDGALPAQEVCRRYADAGYDFLCMSDHFVGRYDYPITDTAAYRSNRFTTILGAEVHSGAMANGELWHLLAVGLPAEFAPSNSPDFKPVDGQESGAEIARRCRDAGAFVAIAHPQWYGQTLADAMTIDAAHAVEIYNHGCAVECGRGDGWAICDLMLSAGRRLSAIATDDAHFHGPDHFGGWVMVKAEENAPEALLAALKAGHFYSSTGPEIRDIAIEGDHLSVACSPAAHVIAVGQNAASAQVHGKNLTRAELPIEKFRTHGWLRVTVMDEMGKCAWSNPIWLDG